MEAENALSRADSSVVVCRKFVRCGSNNDTFFIVDAGFQDGHKGISQLLSTAVLPISILFVNSFLLKRSGAKVTCCLTSPFGTLQR